MSDAVKIATLERRLNKCESALRDFTVIQEELKTMGGGTRVESMRALNADAIKAIGKSLSLIRKDLERELSR